MQHDHEWPKRGRMKPVAHHVDDAELQIEFHARMLACFRSRASLPTEPGGMMGVKEELTSRDKVSK
jgi:hypothetical protein